MMATNEATASSCPTYDVIICSDIAYHIPLFPLLIHSLLDATSSDSVVFMGITKRDVNIEFLRVASCCFEWPAPRVSKALMGQEGVQVNIYTMRRKTRPISMLLHPLFMPLWRH
jgi:hypothetical protein